MMVINLNIVIKIPNSFMHRQILQGSPTSTVSPPLRKVKLEPEPGCPQARDERRNADNQTLVPRQSIK